MSDPKSQQEPSMEEILSSIRRIISEEGGEESTPAPKEDLKKEAQPEGVLELTDMVDEQGNVIELDKAVGAGKVDTVAERREANRSQRPGGARSNNASGQPRDALLSDQVREAAREALSSLTRAPTSSSGDRPELRVAPSGKTIEEYVLELLRPMLREWLDENLPSLVERLVEKEIARLTRRTDSL